MQESCQDRQTQMRIIRIQTRSQRERVRRSRTCQAFFIGIFTYPWPTGFRLRCQ